MCLLVTLPSSIRLFSTRSCTDNWFLAHLKTHDWYLRSGHTLWFCKKMSSSCKDVHSVTFLSPILQGICTVIYSILFPCQVWLPDEPWDTDGTPPCPHCHTQTEVSRIYVFILIMYSIIPKIYLSYL